MPLKDKIKPYILFINTVPSRAIAEAVQELRERGIYFDFKIFYPDELQEKQVKDGELRRELERADAVLIDLRGGGYHFEETLLEVLLGSGKLVFCLPYTPRLIPLVKLGKFSLERFSKWMGGARDFEKIKDPGRMFDWLSRLQLMIEGLGKYLPVEYLQDARNFIRVCRYLSGGGKTNYLNMFLLFCQYLGISAEEPEEPIEPARYGIYHPEFGYFQDLEDYLTKINFNPERPTIGMIFYGGMHLDQAIPTVQAIISRFPDFNFIPVYSSFHTLDAFREYFFKEGKALVDLIFSLYWFRFNGGPLGGDPAPTLELLRKIDVPVITPAAMFLREVEVWKKSKMGLSPIEIICAVTWPELDGCIEPIPACGLVDVSVGGINCKEVSPIEERIERISGRIDKWLKLKSKPNSEKRVGIIIYNYPPGEASLGSASYLDVFQSLEVLLGELAKNNYQVKLPSQPLSQLFYNYHLVNFGRWLDLTPLLENGAYLKTSRYLEIFSRLPLASQQAVIEVWGEPPGKIMCVNGKFLFPGIELGNVFIGVQPTRPPLGKEDLAQAGHDKSIPPHHHYIAFYRWLEEVWKADVIIHLGTHGLAEFTPGKEIGLSGECFPDILIGNLPNLYFYHTLNTSEATIAKRRLYATLIGYNSPPYTSSGLYEDYVQLEDLINEYQEAVYLDPARAKIIEAQIKESAEKLGIEQSKIESIQDELYKIKRAIIPKGLHIIGKSYEPKDCREFMKLLLRYDRQGIKSLPRILIEARGENYDQILKDQKRRAKVFAEIEGLAEQMIDFAFNLGAEKAAKKSGLKGKFQKQLVKTLKFGLEITRRFANNQLELENLIRGLELKFIEPASGGDIIRNPEVLPTGRNLYQFDPNRIPTESAIIRGWEIAENTLQHYLQQNGRYPETIAVVLWGFETTGTGGETIGQILCYLGVELSRRYGSWDPQIQVIPLKKLGRPRIDCLVNICGFFREMFPLQMKILDDAFQKVAKLEEPEQMNFVKKHSNQNLKELKKQIEQGILEKEGAEQIASARIFGPASGEYGTRMLPLIEDGVWENEEQLAEVYISSMAHLHSQNIQAFKIEEIYRKNLSRVELVSQILYSHDFDLIDLDHYYEFFGGLTRSVEKIKGTKPMMLFSDTRYERIETESISKILARSIRTRLLNPKWIDSLLAHPHHGAQKIAQRVEHLIGYAATTHSVENWVWDKVAERFVFDEHTRKRLLENNPFATKELMDRLLEAHQRGYWQPSKTALKKLEEAILEVESLLETQTEKE